MAVERKRKNGSWGYRFSQAGTCYKKYGFPTRAEAKAAEIQFRAELNNNPPPPPEAFGNIAYDYLTDSADPGRGRSLSRLKGLRLSIKKHILPHFGEATLVHQISSANIEKFLLKLKRRGLRPKTVWHAMTDLRSTLYHAVNKGFLRDNPAKDFSKKWGNIIGST